MKFDDVMFRRVYPPTSMEPAQSFWFANVLLVLVWKYPQKFINDGDKSFRLGELFEMKKVLNGYGRGLYLIDHGKEYFIKESVVIDLIKFRKTGKVHFVS